MVKFLDIMSKTVRRKNEEKTKKIEKRRKAKVNVKNQTSNV